MDPTVRIQAIVNKYNEDQAARTPAPIIEEAASSESEKTEE